MLNYTEYAITTKDIDKFNYSLYNAIKVNMLKYNNDSSATIRFLSALIDRSVIILEDLKYAPNFTLTGLEFISIDRIAGFRLATIGMTEENEEESLIVGYSRYSDSYHILKKIDDNSDFIRHSIPVDIFFSDIIGVDDPVEKSLIPNQKIPIDLIVQNSLISITPVYGFSNLYKKDLTEPISVRIFGKDIHNEEVVETVSIIANIDHTSNIEYSYVDYIMVMNATSNVTIKIHPFVTGDRVVWDEMIITRDELDSYPTIVTVDKENKQLVFNTISTDATEYPLTFEKYKTVDIDIEDGGFIESYYIDASNNLLYLIVTIENEQQVSCELQGFPLIIPKSFNENLDNIKTRYQSIKIEYIEDCVNEEFVFWVFPTSKANEVELMTVLIDGIVYQDDILLDLISEDIETNRIIIPFSEIFKNNNETSLVEFRTIGAEASIAPIWIDRTKLKRIFSRTVLSPEAFKSTPDQENFISQSIISNEIPYVPHGAFYYGQEYYGGVTDGDRIFGYGGFFQKDINKLFKLSNVGNVLLDGIKIVNVFDTFYYDEERKSIITSDTISHVKKGDPTYIPPEKEVVFIEKLSMWYGPSLEGDKELVNLEDLTRQVVFTKPVGEYIFGTNQHYIWIIYPEKFGEASLWFSGIEMTFVEERMEINGVTYLTYRSPYKQDGDDIRITLE